MNCAVKIGGSMRRIKDSVESKLVFGLKALEEARAKIDLHSKSYHRYLDAVRDRENRILQVQTLKSLVGGSIKAPLWQCLVELLPFMPDAQPKELCRFFSAMGRKVTPQAIDSALRQHKDIFTAKKRGKHKFISLKQRTDWE